MKEIKYLYKNKNGLSIEDIKKQSFINNEKFNINTGKGKVILKLLIAKK